jgi:hypothetical protein
VVWQIILTPWAFGAIASPLVALFWLTQGRGREAMELGLFAIWFGASFTGLSWLFYARPLFHFWLACAGEEARGVITKLEYHRFARGPKHSLRYRFRSSRGTQYSGLEYVPATAFATQSVGESVDVWYLPRAPFVNVPARFCEYTRPGVAASNRNSS